MLSELCRSVVNVFRSMPTYAIEIDPLKYELSGMERLLQWLSVM